MDKISVVLGWDHILCFSVKLFVLHLKLQENLLEFQVTGCFKVCCSAFNTSKWHVAKFESAF